MDSRIAWSFIVLSEKINLLFTGSVGPDGEKLCACLKTFSRARAQFFPIRTYPVNNIYIRGCNFG